MRLSLGATIYVHNSKEAVEFYQEAFGLTLGYHERYTDGNYWHAELMRDGEELFSVSEVQNDAVTEMMRASTPQTHPPVGLGVGFCTEEEVRKAYRMLSDGGTVLYPLEPVPWYAWSAEVVDKYGICWCVWVPKAEDTQN